MLHLAGSTPGGRRPVRGIVREHHYRLQMLARPNLLLPPRCRGGHRQPRRAGPGPSRDTVTRAPGGPYIPRVLSPSSRRLI